MAATPLPRRIRRADRPGFRNELRNVPTMALVSPARPPAMRAPIAGGWETLALLADGSTRTAAVGTFADCADRANAMGRHPSGGRFVVVPAITVSTRVGAR